MSSINISVTLKNINKALFYHAMCEEREGKLES